MKNRLSNNFRWELILWLIILALCFWGMMRLAYGQTPPHPQTLFIGEPEQSVTLAWDASPDAGVASYRVHQGTLSGLYTVQTNAGSKTTQTVQGLTYDQTYYFAVTAIGSNQLESEFSNELTYTATNSYGAPSGLTSIQWPLLTLNIQGLSGTNWVDIDSVDIVVESTQEFGIFRVVQTMTKINKINY
jgi:hypothetical protein